MTAAPQEPPIRLAEFARSLNAGERANNAFKFMSRMADAEVADFLAGLFVQVQRAIDSGDVRPLAGYVQRVRAARYAPSPSSFVEAVVPPPADAPIPWATLRRPLRAARVALVTTGAVHGHDDRPFHNPGLTYEQAIRDPMNAAHERIPTRRVIPSTLPGSELRASHVAYDVSAANVDVNVMLPVDRLRELAADRVIGGIASEHYSVNVVTNQQRLREQAAPQWAAELAAQGDVDAVVLTPG